MTGQTGSLPGGSGLPNAIWQASPNHGERSTGDIDMLIMHYTGMDTADGACRWLCNPESHVSSHYLVDEAGVVTQMVGEDRRAWHAGVSYWAGESDINSRSIGIEIHNLGPESGDPEFPDPQIEAVIALSQGILLRHPIPATRVLAHSDVAPGRKIDPGPYFPWGQLANNGIGLLPKSSPFDLDVVPDIPTEVDQITSLKQKLSSIGYGIDVNGHYDEATKVVVSAFQSHYRPERIDGLADASTIATIGAVLEAHNSALSV